VKPEIIFNCFHDCKIRSIEELVIDASEECPLDLEVIEDLESQIRQFHYHNPMDIRNLLNYPEEQVTAYTPDVTMSSRINSRNSQACRWKSTTMRQMTAKSSL